MIVEGGCHCRKVRFRAQTESRIAYRCNCSICSMKGFVHVIVEAVDFEIRSGATELSTYQFNTRIAKHTFCSTCGVQPFYTPRSHPHGVSLNLNCIDNGAEIFEVRPFDGQNWERSVAEIQGENCK